MYIYFKMYRTQLLGIPNALSEYLLSIIFSVVVNTSWLAKPEIGRAESGR